MAAPIKQSEGQKEALPGSQFLRFQEVLSLAYCCKGARWGAQKACYNGLNEKEIQRA